MIRRKFLKLAPAMTLASAAALTLRPTLAKAALRQLGPPGPSGVPMEAWVERPTVVKQDCPEWCWAASIAMIFNYYGHPISQETIVQTTYGGTVCAAGGPYTIPADLSSSWTDANGDDFSCTVTAAYDFLNGINAIDNRIIINELENDRPLVYCNTHHAMVLVAADYYETGAEPFIVNCGVLDPYPGIPNFHTLSPPELHPAHMGGQMAFLASVTVS